MNINANNTMDLNCSGNIEGDFEWYGDENDNGCWIAVNENGSKSGFWLAANNSLPLTGDEILMLIKSVVEKESKKLELVGYTTFV